MAALPPGFRFHPTDEELVGYYLRRKIAGRPIDYGIVTEVDLYKQEPWDLPAKSLLPSSDFEWYFFSPRDKKYPNGLRTNRATEAGYWKATGKDRNVKKQGKEIGAKKTLVFYRGRAPHGERTDWVMHEYRLNEEECSKVKASQDLFVLCRVFKKSGVGPRSGEDRGPQTYVDDDLDKEPSGTFAEAVKKALEPGSSQVVAINASPVSTPSPESIVLSVETAKEEETRMESPVDNSSPVLPALSIEDYRVLADLAEQGDSQDMSSVDNFLLDDPVLPAIPTNDEEGQYWDCYSSMSEGLTEWQNDLVGNGGAPGWTYDVGALTLPPVSYEQDQANGEGGLLPELGSDDNLPGLEEDGDEYSNFTNVSNGNSGEDVFPQFLDSTGAKARSEGAPQQRVSITNFSSKVPSLFGGDSGGTNGSGPSEASATSSFGTIRQPSLSDYSSVASASSFDTSALPSGEDNYTFHDSLFDFGVGDDLIDFAADYNESDPSSATPLRTVGEEGSLDGIVPAQPDKSGYSKGVQPVSKPLAGLMQLLGSLAAQPASAAECPPDMKPLLANAEDGSTYSSIHLSALTVTCTSSADGAQRVQAAVTDCHLEGDGRKGVYQQYVSGAWQTISAEKAARVCANCDTAAASGVQERRVARGSSSGFVFVFFLGALSALRWFLLFRGLWSLGSHIFGAVF